jgi:protocatechuate 3,4-dioxygenase beta subunit
MSPRRLLLIPIALAVLLHLLRRTGRFDLHAPLDRRGFVRLLLGVAAAGLAPAMGRARAARLGSRSPAVACVLTPEQTEGPYYIPNEKVRRDIREAHQGAYLDLQFDVVDAATCKPLKGAAVDIWHCDAGGIYSGFVAASNGGPGGGGGPTDKKTFLRGIQRTNARGRAEFTTIYPGWYAGRTVHIHVKVHVGGNVLHTGQLFFSDTLTDRVYTHAPYNRRPNRTTRNADDSIYAAGGAQSTLTVRPRKEGGYIATITMGVQRG